MFDEHLSAIPRAPDVGPDAAAELRAVQLLREQSRRRLLQLEAFGASTRAEERWDRMLAHKESELAAAVACGERADDRPSASPKP